MCFIININIPKKKEERRKRTNEKQLLGLTCALAQNEFMPQKKERKLLDLKRKYYFGTLVYNNMDTCLRSILHPLHLDFPIFFSIEIIFLFAMIFCF